MKDVEASRIFKLKSGNFVEVYWDRWIPAYVVDIKLWSWVYTGEDRSSKLRAFKMARMHARYYQDPEFRKICDRLGVKIAQRSRYLWSGRTVPKDGWRD